jgi:predicted Zn-dependent protease
MTHGVRRGLKRRIARGAAALACAALSVVPASAQSLLRDAEIEAWMRDQTYPLLEAAGVPAAGIEFLLVGDPSFNAFAGPGVIGMNTGTFILSETPNEIEGVLAHEVGHLAGAHVVRGQEAMARAGRPALLSLVLGAALIAAGAPPEAGMGAIGLGQSVGLSNYLAFSRGQESAADQAGLTYLEAVGSSGEGLVTTFQRLSNRQLLTSRRIDPYMQTHPLGAARVTALRDRASGLSHYEEEDSEEEVMRLRMIQAKINGFMDAPYTTLRRYPLSDQSAPARYARAVAYYRMSDLDQATREIDRLIEEQPDNPYFAELKGQMLFEHGQVRESVEPHRRSTELAPTEPLLRINLARALVATEDEAHVEEAIGLLRVALDQEPENGFGWTELARAQARLGNETLASLAQAEAYYAYRDLPSAHRFATRAAEALQAGSPEHQQALDILNVTEDAARRARRGG